MALTAPEGATQSICPSVICQGLLPLRVESELVRAETGSGAHGVHPPCRRLGDQLHRLSWAKPQEL